MRRNVVRAIVPALALISLLLGGMRPASAHPVGEDTDLLANPGFERPYEFFGEDDGGGYVAHGWYPWWYNDDGDVYDGPEFKQASIEIDPYRVRSGDDAQQYFRAWAKHLAGVYQVVQVPENSALQFTIYGHALSSFCKTEEGEDPECDARNSHHGDGANPTDMQIGIDPSGGENPYSESIVWSDPRPVYDNYELFSVEATAQGDQVTVFVRSEPLWPSTVINVYWDDAALVVTGEGEEPAPTTPPDDSPTQPSGGGDVPAQPPAEDGSVWHIVQAGDTLLDIAITYGVSVRRIRYPDVALWFNYSSIAW